MDHGATTLLLRLEQRPFVSLDRLIGLPCDDMSRHRQYRKALVEHTCQRKACQHIQKLPYLHRFDESHLPSIQ